MKLDEFKNTFDGKQQYSCVCNNCGRVQIVRTQKDSDPEYYTPVFIECRCGDWIKFNLPVN